MARLKKLTPEELVLKTVVAPKGADGLPGPRGPQGDKGEKGNDGITGIRGADGAPGLTGEKGERGNGGEKGEEGLQGVHGISGAGGLRGETGPVPKHKWRGTALSFEQPDGEFGKIVDLRGRDGTSGGGSAGGSILSNIKQLRDVRVPTPADGQVLTFDDTTGKWIASTPAAGVTDHGDLTGLADDDHPQYAEIAEDETITGEWTFSTQPVGIDHQRGWREGMSTRAFVFSDFLDVTGGGAKTDGLSVFPAGVGSGASTPTGSYDFTNHPGVWGLNTGTSTAGRVFLLTQVLSGLHVGVGGITRMGFFYQSPAVASDASNRYVLRAGFSSIQLPNTLIQAITFEASDDQNGGRWQAICGDALGVETSVDTGVAVGTSTYFFLEIEINAAGTSVEFFIDGVSVATITTNIPSGTGFGHFISIHIMKLTGVLNRASYIDAYYFLQEVTR